MNRRELVFVGHRNGARRAARAQEAAFKTLDPAADLRSVEDWSSLPDAVVAVTEAAVLPAARLREQLGMGGLSVEAATRCTDKLEMKQAVAAAGIACADFLPVAGRLNKRSLVDRLGLPFVLKKRVGSGGRDARIVRSMEEIPNNVPTDYLAESFVEGVEMSVESFVVNGEAVFTNFTAYVEPKWANLVPATVDTALGAEVLRVNRGAIAALGVPRGITHMEVFLSPGGVVFGELGVRPPGGHIMRLLELAYGFDPWGALIDVESGVAPKLSNTALNSAGVRFIYPNAGVVKSIEGLELLRSLATVTDVVCKLKPGERIGQRQSTGQHRGFAIFAGEAEAVKRDLEAAKQNLHVAVDP